MSNGALAVPEILDRAVEYVPFMSKDAVKLSIRIVKDYLCSPTRKGHVCDDRQAMSFMMLCRARQLDPWSGDAFLVGYDSDKDGPTFSLITAHQAFLKRAEVHPEYDGMDSGVIVRDKDGNLVDREGDFFFDDDFLLGGWAVVYLKNRTHPMKKRIKLSTFNTGYSRWKKDPGGMIVKCASSAALRAAFPTSLGGLFLQDEMPDSDHAMITTAASLPAPSAPPASRADALAARLGAPKSADQPVPVNLKPVAQPEKVPVAPPRIETPKPVQIPAGEGQGDPSCPACGGAGLVGQDGSACPCVTMGGGRAGAERRAKFASDTATAEAATTPRTRQDAPGRDEAPSQGEGASDDHGDAYEGPEASSDQISDEEKKEIERAELVSDIRMKIKASRKTTAGRVRTLIDNRLGDLGVEWHRSLMEELKAHVASIVGE